MTLGVLVFTRNNKPISLIQRNVLPLLSKVANLIILRNVHLWFIIQYSIFFLIHSAYRTMFKYLYSTKSCMNKPLPCLIVFWRTYPFRSMEWSILHYNGNNTVIGLYYFHKYNLQDWIQINTTHIYLEIQIHLNN